MANPPIVSTLTRIERLPLATLTVLCSRMPQGALQIIPAFDPYVRGLIVLQTENQRWAVPVGPGQTIRCWDWFEPSANQWARWQDQWQKMATQWDEVLTTLVPRATTKGEAGYADADNNPDDSRRLFGIFG